MEKYKIMNENIDNLKLNSHKNISEHGLCEIWSLALNTNKVETTDNFFEIGGDSLLALVVIEQIKQRLGWEINLGDFLRYPTIHELIKNRSQQKLTRTDRSIIKLSGFVAKRFQMSYKGRSTFA
jgi:acyl carrier protein